MVATTYYPGRLLPALTNAPGRMCASVYVHTPHTPTTGLARARTPQKRKKEKEETQTTRDRVQRRCPALSAPQKIPKKHYLYNFYYFYFFLPPTEHIFQYELQYFFRMLQFFFLQGQPGPLAACAAASSVPSAVPRDPGTRVPAAWARRSRPANYCVCQFVCAFVQTSRAVPRVIR